MAVSSGPGYCFQPQSMRLDFHHNEICIYMYRECDRKREPRRQHTKKRPKKNIAQHNK